MALIWSEAEGWMAEYSHSKVWTFSLFSRVIQFGGEFLEILVGNIIKIEKKMKDEATLTFVQYVAKNWETSEYFKNIYEKYNLSLVSMDLDLVWCTLYMYVNKMAASMADRFCALRHWNTSLSTWKIFWINAKYRDRQYLVFVQLHFQEIHGTTFQVCIKGPTIICTLLLTCYIKHESEWVNIVI